MHLSGLGRQSPAVEVEQLEICPLLLSEPKSALLLVFLVFMTDVHYFLMFIRNRDYFCEFVYFRV